MEIDKLLIDREQYDSLKNNHQFIDLLQLARIENSLEFCLWNLHYFKDDDSPVGVRQKLRAVLFLTAVLHEAFKRVREMANKYGTKRETPDKTFIDGFERLLNDQDYVSYFAVLSDNIRDQTAFHFDRCAMRIAARDYDVDEILFATTSDSKRHSIYYNLADALDYGYQVSLVKRPNEDPEEAARKMFNAVFEIAEQYRDCSIAFINSRLEILLGSSTNLEPKA